MLASGLILQNRYRVIKQLGQGGMGAVYEAVDERVDATIALKETLFADERLRRQFERLASYKHLAPLGRSSVISHF